MVALSYLMSRKIHRTWLDHFVRYGTEVRSRVERTRWKVKDFEPAKISQTAHMRKLDMPIKTPLNIQAPSWRNKRAVWGISWVLCTHKKHKAEFKRENPVNVPSPTHSFPKTDIPSRLTRHQALSTNPLFCPNPFGTFCPCAFTNARYRSWLSDSSIFSAWNASK